MAPLDANASFLLIGTSGPRLFLSLSLLLRLLLLLPLSLTSSSVDAFTVATVTRRGVARVPLPSPLHLQQRTAVETAATIATDSRTHTKSFASPSDMRVATGLRDVVNDYDVFLLDMWGVLHNGSKPYDGVLSAIQQLRQVSGSSTTNGAETDKQSTKQRRLIILSNSSKRKDHSLHMLQKLGFDVDDFDDVITSGEVAHGLLLRQTAANAEPKLDAAAALSSDAEMSPSSSLLLLNLLESLPNRNVFVLGSGDDDVSYMESCGWTVTSVDEASLIVARGTFTIYDGPDSVTTKDTKDPTNCRYEAVLTDRLTRAARRRLPMLVTNPDKIRPDADRSPMPGMLGDLYEQALAQSASNDDASLNDAALLQTPNQQLVHRIGKPFALVYEMALQSGLLEVDDLSRVCMIGDALETDVTGGSAQGIDTIWVLNDGIHGHHDGGAIDNGTDEALLTRANAILQTFHETNDTTSYAQGRRLSPTIVMRHFEW